MKSAALDRPSITISDINGTEEALLHIDGQPLEQYFAASESLTVPGKNDVAIVDGIPVDLSRPVEAGSSIMVGRQPSNG